MRSGCLTFVNADLGQVHGSLRIAGARLAAVSAAPCAADEILDLQGDRVLPGLINAHDHLQLNTLPAVHPEQRTQNAREWISQVNLRRRTDPLFEKSIAVALNERLLIGGVKNLLCGVTTVAHHDPLFPFLTSSDFPIRVVTHYGWSHSLYIDAEEEVRDSFLRTPSDWPWIIHAAEGLDAEAGAELSRLDALGCLGPNTLIVHGVALGSTERARLVHAGAGLIWCPASNLRLFGVTADVSDLSRSGHVALGTDSRLSGSRDLLVELHTARAAADVDELTLEAMVTRNAAALLRLPDRGTLQVGARADLVVLPAGLPLSKASRADIRLVMLAGRPLYADPDYAQALAPRSHWASVCVDGRAKKLQRDLAAALSAASAGEPGLTISDLTWRAA